MLFDTLGDKSNPAVLFFHAMGVTGKSSEPVAEFMKDRYFCIMPTSTVYCEGQKYVGKADEMRQIEDYLRKNGINRLELVVASSIGADIALAFIAQTDIRVDNIFFDGGQFAQIGKITRRLMTPFLYFAIKSLYWSDGKTLKKIMWCDDDNIKQYFISAGKAMTYKNIRRQMSDSLENKPFIPLNRDKQEHIYFEFGSVEEHLKYRNEVMKAYPFGNFPIFEGHNHMEFQIRNPKGFSEMLCSIIEKNELPSLPFLKG